MKELSIFYSDCHADSCNRTIAIDLRRDFECHYTCIGISMCERHETYATLWICILCTTQAARAADAASNWLPDTHWGTQKTTVTRRTGQALFLVCTLPNVCVHSWNPSHVASWCDRVSCHARQWQRVSVKKTHHLIISMVGEGSIHDKSWSCTGMSNTVRFNDMTQGRKIQIVRMPHASTWLLADLHLER